MPYYVVAFPKLKKSDLDWIADYRHAHDPESAARIGPHFTLVFGIDCAKEHFLHEVAKQAAGFGSIRFELRLATLNLDARSGCYLEHLVPEAGYSDLALLHDRLYADAFTAHQRLDLGYVPHITIGRCEKAADAKARVNAINHQGITIHGEIDELQVFDEGGNGDEPLATIALTGK